MKDAIERRSMDFNLLFGTTCVLISATTLIKKIRTLDDPLLMPASERKSTLQNLAVGLLDRRRYPVLVSGATFITLVCAAGVLSAPTMFVRPFETEYGWSAGQISMA